MSFTEKTLGEDTAIYKDFFTSLGAQLSPATTLRFGAKVRLIFIYPTLYLLTFINFLYLMNFQEIRLFFFLWLALSLLYVPCNIFLYFTGDSRILLLRGLTYLALFIEVFTNHLVIYLIGTLLSHGALFIILIISLYRVYLDYRFSLFALVLGSLLFLVTVGLELYGLIPISPGLPGTIEHPLLYTREGVFFTISITMAIVMSFFITFFTINYGMNQSERLRIKLLTMSFFDTLTGIANRRSFEDYLTMVWNQSFRYSRPLSMIMVDIDAFKQYNDTYGHQVGDSCLKEIAQALQRCVKRSTDCVARYGGEEFAIILPDTPLIQARNLAEEVRAHIESLKIPHSSSPVKDYVTISLGVSWTIPHKKDGVDLFIQQADRALYIAKERGRNRVEIYQ